MLVFLLPSTTLPSQQQHLQQPQQHQHLYQPQRVEVLTSVSLPLRPHSLNDVATKQKVAISVYSVLFMYASVSYDF